MNYRVFLRSKPGFYEQYDGYVDVAAPDEDVAIDRAFEKLQRTTFTERRRNMWKVERVERRYEA